MERRKAEVPIAPLLLIIALMFMLVTSPLYGKIFKSNDSFLFQMDSKKCDETGNTFGYYKEELKALDALIKENPNDSVSINKLSELCEEVDSCFPEDSSVFDAICDKTKNDGKEGEIK